MHGHTGGRTEGGGHLPPPHHQPHQAHHLPAHSPDPWNPATAPWDPPPRQNRATILIRDPRVISTVIALAITVVLLVLFTF